MMMICSDVREDIKYFNAFDTTWYRSYCTTYSQKEKFPQFTRPDGLIDKNPCRNANANVKANLQNLQLQCDWEFYKNEGMVLKSCQVFQFSRKLYLDPE